MADIELPLPVFSRFESKYHVLQQDATAAARSLPELVRADAEKLRRARLALPAEERLARAESWLRERVNAPLKNCDTFTKLWNLSNAVSQSAN